MISWEICIESSLLGVVFSFVFMNPDLFESFRYDISLRGTLSGELVQAGLFGYVLFRGIG